MPTPRSSAAPFPAPPMSGIGTMTSSPVVASTVEDFLRRSYPVKEPLAVDLLNKRDLVTFGARRRNGKTSFVTNLAVAGAEGPTSFLGYDIPSPFRTLLLILEDDAGEYQEKLRHIVGSRKIEERIKLVTKEDFLDANVQIDVGNHVFRDNVERFARDHTPDLIIIDNVAQVIAAEYNDANRVHTLVQFAFSLARTHNAAIVLPAHPKKEDPSNRVSLLQNPTGFFESVMGSSHLINSTGCLWGMEREEATDRATFLGGRQRGDGNQRGLYLEMGEDGWYQIIPDAKSNLELVLNTEGRRKAWALLPDPPQTFGFREGHAMVKRAMSSSSTYSEWMSHCRRLKVVVDTGDEKLMKAISLRDFERVRLDDVA